MAELSEIVSAAVYIFAYDEIKGWCILCGRRSGNNERHQGGKYDVPVGMLEQGETPADAAKRETYEETGINIPNEKFCFINKQPWGEGNVGSNFICILDKCQEIGRGDWEHDYFVWLPVHEIDRLTWAYGMDKTIKELYTRFIQKNKLTEDKLKKIIKECIKEILWQNFQK